MIDEKKIEEAAFDLYQNDKLDFVSSESVEGFKEGAKWAINEFLKNLWHPTSEEPKEKQKLIVEMTNEECHSAYRINKWYYISDVNMEYKVSVKTDSIYRWFYIDVLLTKEGGKHD